MTEIDKAVWPPEDLEAVPNCPVCASDRSTILHADLEDWNFLCAPGSWNLKQCSNCRSAYLDPRPTPSSIGRAYSLYYTHANESNAVSQRLRDRIRAALANDYRNWRYSTKRKPALFGGRFIGRVAPKLVRGIDVEFGFVPRRTKGNRRLLDIGSGGGGFLDRAREAGWSTSGVEPDPVSGGECRKRGFEIFRSIDEIPLELTFDAVTMSHSIEHVHQPSEMIVKVAQLLKPSGHLFIDTPNIRSGGHKIYGKFWRHLDAPRHLTIFNSESLVGMLEGTGFQDIIVHSRHEVPMEGPLSPIPMAIEISPTNYSERTKLPPFYGADDDRSEYVTITARKKPD